MSKWVRSMSAVAGTLLVAASLGACGSSGDNSTGASSSTSGGDSTAASSAPLAGKKIGISPYWLDESNTLYTDGMKKYLTAQGAEVTILNPNADAAKQRDQVNTFITDHYDAVILEPINAASAVPMLRQLQNSDIRTALFWNVPPADQMQGLKAPVFEVNNFDSFEAAGKAAAAYVKDKMHQDPKAIIFDNPSNPINHARAVGFEQGLKSAAPNADVLFNDSVELNGPAARAKMADLLQSYPEANVIMPNIGEAAVGAYGALKAAGRGKADDKVAKTEYVLASDPDSQLMDMFVDPSTSVIDMVQTELADGGVEVGKVVEQMLQSPDWKQMDQRQAVPSRLMSRDCAAAAKEFAEQSSSLKDYRPVDCSKAS